MAQRKKSRGHRYHPAAAGLSGPAIAHAQSRVLHSVDTHPPSTNEASIWGRRRVLLLNSTYEPLTALPMRRAVIMLMCGKASVVHDDPNGPVIHSATKEAATTCAHGTCRILGTAMLSYNHMQRATL